ncbi:glycosyl hydrolase family protein [Actinidia rufa]|uniref:Glycosyl hydrolase family protein n=1 Tax=Actinidia rufa TaxID=165716 RepID=A0A7J0FSH8_9ERIC|nr:glycosyl hydrolase family protein [Actinidia rufa]
MQPQSVRRRNVKEKDNQVFVQEGVEEKDMFFSTISNDALVDKAALEEENPKEIREVMVDSVVHRTESSSAASQRSRHERGDRSEGTNKSNGGRGEFKGESSEDGEDEGEEEAQEDGNKAVEWTEDDRKNLMDLGISEMERNTRLESLIARRRARKLLSMQVRSTLMNASSNDPCSHIASILLPRSNPFPSNDSGGAQISPAPGSAPSVLLPMHNPFDIPYDPQEEKPNLTGGGFEEEFIADHQKDTMFCRHESFSLGSFFPGPGEFDQSRREAFYCPNFSTRQRSSEIPEYSRFRNQSGSENSDKRIQTESSEECKPVVHINNPDDHGRQEGQGPEHIFDLVDTHHEEDRSEVHIEENIVRDVTGGSSSSSSSEMSVPFSAANRDQILKSLSFSVLRNIGVDREYDARRNEVSDGSPPTFGKRRLNECFFHADKGVNHTPTHSIASDLQVEVSEVGSPELTVDGTISPSDGESLIYEANADVEKETASGSEEMWVASSRLSRVEENESRSREVHEVSEQDIIEVGFSRISHKFEDIVASDMPEKAVEFPESSQTHSTDFDGKVHEVQPPSTYSSEALSTEDLGSLTLENAWQSRERSEASPSCHGNSGKPEEVTIIYENDQVVITNDDEEDILEFIKDTYGEAHTLTKRETPDELSVLTTKSNVKQGEITEVNSGDLDNDHSNSPDYFDEEFKTPSVLGLDTTSDSGSSGDNSNSNDSIASVTQPAIMTEQGPNDASSSSSSTSVTEKKAPISQASLPIYDQITHTKVQQIGAKVVDDNFLDRRLPESSNLTVSHDTLLHLTEDSATYLCDDRNPGKLQGEHQTTMESYKPVEENVNLGSSEDLQKQVIGFSGVSQTFNGPIPSTMLPELVVEQILMALSSSSSHKFDAHKMVSVEQASSYTPPSPQNAQHLPSNSTTYPSYDKDLEELLEPSNSFQELNSIDTETSYRLRTITLWNQLEKRDHDGAKIRASEVSLSPDVPIAPVMLIGAVLQDALHVTEDPQEPSSYPVKPTEEGSVNDMNDSASSEKEEKLNSESVEDASIISNENESVVNVRVDEDNLRSSVDESGSMLSGGGSLPFEKAQLSDWADMVDGYQKLALESRLRIPMIYAIDTVHGNNNVYGATIFPHSIGLGATRDADLVYRIGVATALEVGTSGVHYNFAPSRDFRWGRCYECYNVDTEIVRNMTSLVSGLQRQPTQGHPNGYLFVAGRNKVVGCAKHFVGDGGTDKDTTSDSGSSGDNSNSNDSIASVTQPAIMTEQGPNDASSSSSSTSVTEKKAPISQASLPIYDQITHTKVQQIGAEVVDDNFLDRRLPESSNLTVSHDTLHLTEDSATYLCDDRNPGKLQGEHQTTMESYKPVEENVNLGSSEDLQKQVIGFSGVSQTFNGPIPSTMLPELVVEQVLMALSSSSSPKFDAHKMVSVDQASSYSIDPETQLKAEKSDENIVEINLSDKLLPENSAPPSPQNAQHLPSNSTAYPSYDKDLEELQEPSNSFQELNSIDSVKNSEVPANDENLIIIEDTNSEAQELAREENARQRLHTRLRTITLWNQLENVTTMVQKLEHLRSAPSPDVPIAPVMLIGTGESGLLGQNQSFTNDSNPPALLPEVVVEPVPFATSSSSSPTSVLQQKFSIDQASVLSFEQDVLMEIQQSETEMEESTTLNELPFENSTGAVLQDALHVTEDPQEPSSYPVKSTEEGSVNDMNDSASSEKEEKLNSESVEDGEGQPKLLTKQEARIDPMDPSNVEGRSDGLEQMTDNGESMISKDIGDRSMPTNTKENLKATEVEGESKYLNANEANVVALAKPVEQNDDSNIPDLATADPCISIEEASIISNENQSGGQCNLPKTFKLPQEEGVGERRTRRRDEEWSIGGVSRGGGGEISGAGGAGGGGSILSGGGSLPFEKAQLSDWADMVDGYQKLALKSRLRIPMIYAIDTVHGNNNVYGATIFPHSIGLGATRDTDLVYRIGVVTALEVAREFRWGRCYECYNDDTEIVRNMTSLVSGLQRQPTQGHPNGYLFVVGRNKVIARAKHFVGDGGTNKGINEGCTIASMTWRRFTWHLIWTVFLRVCTVMASYSSWNGNKMHSHHFLLTQVLKDKLGFKGFVISDWEALDRLSDPRGSNYRYGISSAINAEIDMAAIKLKTDAVERILRVKIVTGLFEYPMADRSLLDTVGCKKVHLFITFTGNLISIWVLHRELAREAVCKSLVLLKNGKDPQKPFLPLDRNSKKFLLREHMLMILDISVEGGQLLGLNQCSHIGNSHSLEGPLLIETWLLEKIDALAAAGLPGSEGSRITNVIFGDYEFQGWLPMTWFRSVEQLPLHAGHFGLTSNGKKLSN